MSIPDRELGPPDDAHCPVCEHCTLLEGGEDDCWDADEHKRCSEHDNSDLPEE